MAVDLFCRKKTRKRSVNSRFLRTCREAQKEVSTQPTSTHQEVRPKCERIGPQGIVVKIIAPSAAYSAPLMNRSEEKWSSFQPICILVSCLLRKIKTGGWFFTGGADHPIAWKAIFFFEKKCANTSKLPASEKQMIQSHYSFVSFSFIEYHRVI